MREFLRSRLGAERFDLWLGAPCELRLEETALHVWCVSRAELQWIKRRMLPELVARCSEFLRTEAAVVLHVQRAATPVAAAAGVAQDGAETQELLPLERPGPRLPRREPRRLPERPAPKPRSDRWTFATFVEGPGNRLARHMAGEAARQPGRYSPLVLFGAAGTGKSHLLEATAHDALRHDGRRGVVLVTAEQFTAQFLEALDRRLLPSFREKYRRLGMLLVDDVQFFAGKRATIDEFLHTVDAIQRRDGQIVLAGDRSPAEMQSISADLAARISAGLAVQIDLPDYATRLAIVRGISLRLKLDLADEALELVAQQVVGSARSLGGAINRLVATGMARSTPITVELATEALGEFCRQHVPQVRLADIQRAVCEVFGVEAKRLKSDNRSRSVSEPRTLAMWLARKYTRAALSEIGDFFGRRSHSTVVAAHKRFDELIRREGEITVGDAACSVEEAIRRVENALRTA
ncbi:MAG: chromosomal replication initiator protein DnaA [Pirellulales bacterium]|nr:chromosomal replication initiator protein DnaA [Pirellulales bacterium]